MLHENLQKDMRSAMKEGDTLRLGTLRLAAAACTNELISSGKKPTDVLDDEQVVTVVRRLVKQRSESAAQYRAAGQEERATAEDKERVVLESYLPPEMSEDEVRAIVARVCDEIGVSEKKDKGLLMKTAMREMKGKAGGSVVAKIVDEVLS